MRVILPTALLNVGETISLMSKNCPYSFPPAFQQTWHIQVDGLKSLKFDLEEFRMYGEFYLVKVDFKTTLRGMAVPVRHELSGNLSGENFLIAHGDTWVTFTTSHGYARNNSFLITVTILEYTGMFKY